MNFVKQPSMDSKCDSCSCTFGKHWSSYDGSRSGCTTDWGQRDGTCTCKGFAFIYRPQVTLAYQPTAEDYYNK